MASSVPFRSLAQACPEVAAQWHPTANEPLTPEAVSWRNDRKVWWLCPEGHGYQAAVGHRTGNGSGCPYCSNSSVLAGFNDMATTHPHLAAQWHPTRNDGLRPNQVLAGANRKRWWVCPAGHEYESLSSHRAKRDRADGGAGGGAGCPYCANKKVLAGFNDLATTHPHLVAEWDDERNGPLRPCDVVAGRDAPVWWRCAAGHRWQAPCFARTGPRRSGCPTCAGRPDPRLRRPLSDTHPGLAAQWHPTRNLPLTPDCVSAGSEAVASWLCPAGHQWEEPVSRRTRRQDRCPVCEPEARRPQPTQGVDDLASTHPDLAAQWHPALNGRLTPQVLTAGSTRRVWWRCARGHDWDAVVYSRTGRNASGCPVCSNKRCLPGVNDLVTTHPWLAAQWHPTRNGTAGPDHVLAGSSKRRWWACAQGHEWPAAVSSRKDGSRGCPYCSGALPVPGVTDLRTTHPGLAVTWHPTLNGTLTPRQVTAGSGRLVHWSCPAGHAWRAAVHSRTGQGTGCPYCANKAVLPGFNDLATTHPGLAEQWHPTRNGTLRPDQVMAGTARKLWWMCPSGHEWPAAGSNRARLGVGCPDCAPVGLHPNRPGAAYVVTDGHAHKVGVMNTGSNRVQDHRRRGWTLARTWWFPLARHAFAVEQETVRRLRAELRLPPGYRVQDMPQYGATETVAAADMSLPGFLALVEQVAHDLGEPWSHEPVDDARPDAGSTGQGVLPL